MKAKWVALATVLLALGGILSITIANNGIPLISLIQSAKFADFTSSNGELGLYLVGTWDVRLWHKDPADAADSDVSETHIQLINPTRSTLAAFVAFFDDAENGLTCEKRILTQNDLEEITISEPIDGKEFGVVKIVSTNLDGKPEIGLVGYKKEIRLTTLIQRLTDGGSVQAVVPFVSESRLQPVPPEVLFEYKPNFTFPDELSKIKALCEDNF